METLKDEVKQVNVIDMVKIIETSTLKPPYKLENNLEESIEKVKSGVIDAVIYYPESLLSDGKFIVYARDGDLFSKTVYSMEGFRILKENAIQKISDPVIKIIATMNPTTETILYDNQGIEIKEGLEKYIIPVVSIVIFFISVFISSSFLLQSVCEEKENRMIEILLSMVKPKTLIYGKIIGLSGVVLTQLVIWIVLCLVFSYLAINQFGIVLSFNIENIPLSIIPINIYFTFMGFLMFASIMVGVGSIGTNYKESQNLSSIFIILSVIPMYFITFLVSEPNGILARILSYFPLTAPMIFIVRNSLIQLTWYELAIGIILVAVYVMISFYLAVKFFNLGALMYIRKPSLKEVIHAFRKS